MQVVKEEEEIIPTVKDLDNSELSNIPKYFYVKIYGSYNNFLNIIGESNNKKFRFTKQDLIDNYYKVKEKLGRIPVSSDFNDRSISNICLATYKNHFGNYSDFKKSIGEFQKPSKQDLIDNYYEVKRKLKRVPNCDIHMCDKNISRFGKHRYYDTFGTWNNFLKSINEPLNITYYTKQDFIDNYYKIKDQLQRHPPSVYMVHYSEISYQAYCDHFGSWENFLKSINEPISKYNHKKT